MDYTLLEPSFSKSLGFDTSSGLAKISGSFVESSVFIFSLLISLSVLGFAYSISRAGILRTEASESNIRKSNEMIKNATLGLLGVLALYLIIGTINPALLQGDVGLSGLSSGPIVNNQSQAGGAGATGEVWTPIAPTTTETTAITPTKTKPSPDDPVWKSALAEDGNTRDQLLGFGVTVNHPACSDVSQTSGCTTVGGLPSDVVNMLGSLKNKCGCSVVITGGTENGHKTHGPGMRAVDLQILSDSDSLYSFIKKNGDPTSLSDQCRIYYSWGGFTFWDEKEGCSGGNTGRHWHVS